MLLLGNHPQDITPRKENFLHKNVHCIIISNRKEERKRARKEDRPAGVSTSKRVQKLCCMQSMKVTRMESRQQWGLNVDISAMYPEMLRAIAKGNIYMLMIQSLHLISVFLNLSHYLPL